MTPEEIQAAIDAAMASHTTATAATIKTQIEAAITAATSSLPDVVSEAVKAAIPIASPPDTTEEVASEEANPPLALQDQPRFRELLDKVEQLQAESIQKDIQANRSRAMNTLESSLGEHFPPHIAKVLKAHLVAENVVSFDDKGQASVTIETQYGPEVYTGNDLATGVTKYAESAEGQSYLPAKPVVTGGPSGHGPQRTSQQKQSARDAVKAAGKAYIAANGGLN